MTFHEVQSPLISWLRYGVKKMSTLLVAKPLSSLCARNYAMRNIVIASPSTVSVGSGKHNLLSHTSFLSSTNIMGCIGSPRSIKTKFSPVFEPLLLQQVV